MQRLEIVQFVVLLIRKVVCSFQQLFY